jgi:hypothetical protein
MTLMQTPRRESDVQRDVPSPPRERPPADGVPTAERAECTCPEFCERDHAND